MDKLEELLDVVFEKQDVMEQTYNSLERLLEECQSIKQNLEETSSDEVDHKTTERIQHLHEVTNQLELASKFNHGQRQLHLAINAFDRTLKNGFEIDLDNLSRDVEIPSNIVYNLIAEHLLCYGYENLSNKIIEACNISISQESKILYEQLNGIIRDIRKKNMTSALTWIDANRESIGKSDLEFSVHKLHFLNLVKERRGDESLIYAQKHFYKFKSTDMTEIYSLMGSLAFSGININSNPYKNLRSDDCQMKVESLFFYEFCKLNNLPTVSHLYSMIRAGIEAIPNFIKVKSLSPAEHWMKSDKVNVEIQLPNEVIFHSTFCCPVSKEISTPENPPVLLPCGHVISKNSVSSLQTTRNRYSDFLTRFKCPYCPYKVQSNQLLEIMFE